MLGMLKNSMLQELYEFVFFGNQQGRLWAFMNILLSEAMTQISHYNVLQWLKSTTAGVCNTPCPQHMLAPKYGQICNVPEFHKFLWNLLKSYSGNLLFIPYQLTKFEAPSSNSFQDILLISLKCLYFQRAIPPEKLHSKVNQVIYSSSPISWPSFKPLDQIVFEMSCWQV